MDVFNVGISPEQNSKDSCSDAEQEKDTMHHCFNVNRSNHLYLLC
jgi:hypothetical protein